MIDAATSARLALLANGYNPIPLTGKKPRFERWPHHLTNPDEIAVWALSYPEASNTGVTCWHTPTIDIDIADQEAAEALEQLAFEQFGERGRLMIRVGMAPKRAILLRAGEPFGKLTCNLIGPGGKPEKIEILGDGQQVVVFGIHPDTGKPYRWFGGDPTTIEHALLPDCNRAQAEAFLTTAGDLLVAEFGYRRGDERPKGNGQTPAGSADWGWLLESIAAGKELHDSTAVLAAKLITSGMGDGAAVNIIRGAYAQCAVKDERWQERYADIPRAVESARGKYEQRGEAVAKPAMATTWDDKSTWGTCEPPPQEWTIPDLIPAREVCIFSGSGGSGKSTIALHLCAAHAVGLSWLNWVPKRGPSFFIDCEDHLNVVWRRLAAVVRHLGCSFDDLRDLHILSLHGREDTLFATAGRDGKILPTPMYRWVLAEAERLKPVQIVLASSANIYAGSEIDRSQVTQFIGLLAQIANASGGSVILISHPSLAGTTNASGLSGSTGWHNTVRARMYLESSKNGEDETVIGPRLLKFLKNQYGPEAAQTALEYRNGIFLPPVAPTDYEQAARTARAEAVLLAVMRRMMTVGMNFSGAPKANNYAPRVVAAQPEARAAKVNEKDLATAMWKLLETGKIKSAPYGYPSRKQTRIEPV